MEAFWHFVRSPSFGTIFRLVIGEIHQFPDLAQFYTTEVILRARNLIARIIQRGVATGEFRPVDPAVAARMFSALFSTTAMWCSKRHCFPHMENIPDDQVFEQLVDFYLHAIRA
jgi:hypothetical protein